MELKNNEIFVDWITVQQTHEEKHQPFSAGIRVTYDADGNVERKSTISIDLEGKFGSKCRIYSDGQTVQFDGNPSRWNRPDNLFGEDLDTLKDRINAIVQSVGLPPFTGGKKTKLNNGEIINTGARFSRIDMTANIATGSPRSRDNYLKHLQAQTYGRMEKSLIGLNTYFGHKKSQRLIRIYDKAKQLRDKILRKSKDKKRIRELINYCDANGIVRFEIEYRKWLARANVRHWDNATHDALCAQTKKEIGIMTEDFEEPNFDEIPNAALGTLTMYMAGIDVKKRLSPKTFYNHRKVLKKFGYDIANQNIHILQPKVQIVTLRPAEIPDWYKMPEAM